MDICHVWKKCTPQNSESANKTSDVGDSPTPHSQRQEAREKGMVEVALQAANSAYVGEDGSTSVTSCCTQNVGN